MSELATMTAGIQQALAAYAQALDDGRTDDLVATFCEDGTTEFPGSGKVAGHAALRATYARLKPRAPQRHIVANTLVTASDDGQASAVSDLVMFAKGDAGWAVVVVGRYDDTFRCVDGVWRFQSRTLTLI